VGAGTSYNEQALTQHHTKMKNSRNKTAAAFAALTLATLASSANAQTVLSSEDFEAATSSSDYANTDYDKGGILGGSDDGAIDLNGIANVPSDAGDNTTKTAFGRSSNRVITTRDALPLHTNGHTSVTVSFDYYYNSMPSTSGITLQYSAAGDFTDTQNVNQWLAGTTNNQWQNDTTATLTEGTYTFTDTARIRFKSGGAANNDHGYLDNIVITGIGSSVDMTPPTLASSDIVDDQFGGPVFQNALLTYTLTFSENMDDSTFSSADFGNGAAVDPAAITIGTITETSPGVFTVEVTPTSTGNLEFEVPIGATLEDAAGNPLDTTAAAITDDNSITVNSPDTTDPTLLPADIVDDQTGGPVNQNSLVIYTVTFSEDMDDSTFSSADFGNGAAVDPAAITIGSITETSPGVFTVEVTPTSTGNLEFEVPIGATLEDPSGNLLDTAAAITDDNSITVNASVTTVLSSEDFEGATTSTDYANTDYDKGGILGAGDDGTIDLNGIANVPSDAGDNTTKTAFGRSSNRVITTRDALPLDTNAHTSVTVSFDYYYNSMPSSSGITLQYSAAGDFTDTQNVNQWLAGTTNNQWQNDTVTLTEGTYTFTDTARIRFKSGGAANNDHGYLDNIVITGIGGGGGGGNDFSDWIAGYDVGTEDGIGDDPDLDGNDNGVENFFGTAPDTFTQGLVSGTVSGNTFTFTHPLNATPADDLTAVYRWSTELQTFYDDGASNGAGTTTVDFVQGTPSGGMVTVTATITGTVIPAKLFVDVEVTQN